MIQRRFRSAGNGPIFDNSLNDMCFWIDNRMENGYKKGCKRGATKK